MSIRRLTITEIRDRALKFSSEWQDEGREQAESHSFWDGFFEVFGVSRRRLATFEEPVRRLKNTRGRIDLLWRGTLLVEHKSRGEDLDSAYGQALTYFEGISEDELPRYVLVSDFHSFRLYDLEEGKRVDFELRHLHRHLHEFAFIHGYSPRTYTPSAPVNAKAAELLAGLHDELRKQRFTGHDLEVFMVRVLFCLFADHAGIFSPGVFRWFVDTQIQRSADAGPQLNRYFRLLDTKPEVRPPGIDDELATLPYVNGDLFTERLEIPEFTSTALEKLGKCCLFDWSLISPAVFGAMFQAVLDKESPKLRRNLGAHYTSEDNIMKVIEPLFLGALRQEFVQAVGNTRKLQAVLKKLRSVRVLDPACGCGNFLVITYRELRRLETAALEELHKVRVKAGAGSQVALSVDLSGLLNIDCLAGLEVEEWPARVAETALWLVDHQLNLETTERFSQYFARLPLQKRAKIKVGNALKVDWATLFDGAPPNIILGNPPFIGKKARSPEQVSDHKLVFGTETRGVGELDYVACWFARAAPLAAAPR